MSKSVKYDSGINVLGSIPDYALMLDFICEYAGGRPSSDRGFSFRTYKTFNRFLAAIKASILQFYNENQKRLFLEAIASEEWTLQEKLVALFWQLVAGNTLFRQITEEVLMKAVYQGRTSLTAVDVLSYLHYLRSQEPGELDWAEATLKITASKYLTILKKMGLADGAIKKEIKHPLITHQLFVYFIKWMLYTYPEANNLDNPLLPFAFMEKGTLIERLKRVDYLSLWNICQMGEQVTINLLDHE